jgi:hypothetical protein
MAGGTTGPFCALCPRRSPDLCPQFCALHGFDLHQRDKKKAPRRLIYLGA